MISSRAGAAMVRPWGMQPDESYPLGLIRQVADGVERLDYLVRGNGGDGILTRLSHLERTDREMAAKLDSFLAEVRASVATLENDLQMVKLPTKTEEARWYARGKFWIWLTAATGVVGHLATLASIILERF